ncbi:MAG: SDR family NAD(P)-dependent oxidoreductase [Anaerolineae bacterium]|nr:SDR family oxidoreductase [Thermoflexales bacterium]MDW8407312.1 SDR family NAD(P)-dependent oxidoreductase [Anaerolineae bacterium]
MTLNNKIVLIVGGAAGIGKATAGVCAERGAMVIVGDFNVTEGARVAEDICARGQSASFVPVDVTEEASVSQMFDHIRSQHGRLDALVQCAGVLKGAFVPVEDFPLDVFRHVVEVNLTGSFLCAKHAVPLMKKNGKGVIVLVSSGAAHSGSSSVAYGSSKGGVSSLGITLASKLAPDNIRVNVVHPGEIRTAMKLSVIAAEAELKGQSADAAIAQASSGSRLGEPEGMGKILAWLVSDDADYVRGFIHTR